MINSLNVSHHDAQQKTALGRYPKNMEGSIGVGRKFTDPVESNNTQTNIQQFL